MMFQSKAAKAVLALALAGVTLTATVDPADARWRGGGGGWRAGGGWGGGVVRHHRGGWGGPAVAAGVFGLAAGAIAAGAASSAYAAPGYYYNEPVYDYGPSYSTYYAPAYARPAYARPVYRRYVASEPVCTIRRKRVWLSSNTYTFRRVTTCR
jgi:hypothetical protein